MQNSENKNQTTKLCRINNSRNRKSRETEGASPAVCVCVCKSAAAPPLSSRQFTCLSVRHLIINAIFPLFSLLDFVCLVLVNPSLPRLLKWQEFIYVQSLVLEWPTFLNFQVLKYLSQQFCSVWILILATASLIFLNSKSGGRCGKDELYCRKV